MLGVEPVGLGVKQHGLFLLHPVGTAIAAQFSGQALIDGAQPDDVGERIVDLPFGEGRRDQSAKRARLSSRRPAKCFTSVS